MFLEQPNYLSLKETIGVKSSSIILWLGAGLSIPAGFPNWVQLRDRILEKGYKNVDHLDDAIRNKKNALLDVARMEDDLWESFGLLEKALGKASFEQAVREVFKKAASCKIPGNYEKLVELPISGIINLNVDGLATRAFTQKNETSPIQFNGLEIKKHLYAIKDPRPFILNVHGTFDNRDSWVFKKDDLIALSSKKEYHQALNNCFVSHTIIFVGIGVDDIAISKHLDSLQGTDFGEHFWITDRNDSETNKFCEENRILPIYYSSKNDHAQLSELIQDMISYKAEDEVIDKPVLMVNENSPGKLRNFQETDLSQLSENELRDILNKKATSIIAAGKKENYKAYEEFRKQNLKFINRAWFLDVNTENTLFNYTLKEEIGEGAFGLVYLAEDKEGNQVAIKLLKQDIMRKDERLQSFRRGVASMKILSDRNVNGMVRYHNASEIPAFVAMDYVAGINLKEAIKSGQIKRWSEILKVLEQTSNILRKSHHLAERVLHRDIRPPNIMLKGFDYSNDEWKVILLDFDLACYKDAHEVSIDHTGSINGFLAPEQLMKNGSFSSRNSLVDSFGLGMIIFYLLKRSEPYFKQHESSTWNNTLKKIARQNPCKYWESLPIRLTRLIKTCTSTRQNERYDMMQIWGEISLLKEAFENPRSVESCQMLAEELCYRVAKKIGQEDSYKWNLNKEEASLTLLSGSELKFRADDSNSLIFMSFNWISDNNYNFESIKNKLKDTINASVNLLIRKNFIKNENWECRKNQAHFDGELSSYKFANQMDALVKVFVEIINKFRF